MPENVDRRQLRSQWEAALAEDGFERDVTSLVAVPQGAAGTATLVAREKLVFAGSVVLDLVREAYGTNMSVTSHVQDGASVKKGGVIATLSGSLPQLLVLERTLLNYLQRLCGIATTTKKYVDAVRGTQAKILDTRKTVPGWRQLDKYAVRCGGGRNHRMGLHDAVLVKDNHLAHLSPDALITAAANMIEQASRLQPPPAFIEFEVDSLEQLDALLKVRGIDVILLDNFSPTKMRQAVKRRDKAGLNGLLQLEASGGVTLESVRNLAETGIERISVGDLTHSVRAVDIGMDLAVT